MLVQVWLKSRRMGEFLEDQMCDVQNENQKYKSRGAYKSVKVCNESIEERKKEGLHKDKSEGYCVMSKAGDSSAVQLCRETAS